MKFIISALASLPLTFSFALGSQTTLDSLLKIEKEQVQQADRSQKLSETVGNEDLRSKYHQAACDHLDGAKTANQLGKEVARKSDLQAPPSTYIDGRYYTFECKNPNPDADSLRDDFIRISNRFIGNAHDAYEWAVHTEDFDQELADIWFEAACNRISIANSFAGLGRTAAKLLKQDTAPADDQLILVAANSEELECSK